MAPYSGGMEDYCKAMGTITGALGLETWGGKSQKVVILHEDFSCFLACISSPCRYPVNV
jgi:hypothetical protein